MSYILDALKKSEQQRQRGAAPSLVAAQVTDAAPRQPAGLLYGLAVAALLVVGIAIGMLRPWQAAAPALQSVAVKPPEAVVPSPPPAPATVEITIKTERQTPVPAPTTPPALPPAGDAVKPQVPVPAAQTVPSKSAAAPEKKASSPAPERPAGARPADAAPERMPTTFAELPASIQQEIPKLSILFHIHSGNPKDGLVGINDRTFREGDAVEPGLVLEQITPDGMILTYKGYRFLRGTR